MCCRGSPSIASSADIDALYRELLDGHASIIRRAWSSVAPLARDLSRRARPRGCCSSCISVRTGTVAWTDQDGYRQLGAVMRAQPASSRAIPTTPSSCPEVIRTPGYPAFVALVYAVAGGNDVAVAVAQAFVFAAICWLVYALARRISIVLPPPTPPRQRVAGTRPGGKASLRRGPATALFPPIPYFGALVLTEVWTTLVVTLAMLVCLARAAKAALRDFAIAGVLFGCTTLVRPAFVLLPFVLALGVPLLVPPQRPPSRIAGWAALALAGGAARCCRGSPTTTCTSGQFTLSPAGGVGRGSVGRLLARPLAGHVQGAAHGDRRAGDRPASSIGASRGVAARPGLDPAADARLRARVARHPPIWEAPAGSARAGAGARRRRRGVSPRRARRTSPTIPSGMCCAALTPRAVRAVGRRHPHSLHRHQRDADVDHSRDLAGAGAVCSSPRWLD